VGLFGKKARPEQSSNLRQLVSNLTEAEVRYLEALRREIANLIVESDPDLMVKCYEKAWAFEREIAGSPERATAEEAALSAKFPMFRDFDILETRHFVPYQTARQMLDDDDLIERYHEISRMLVFMRRRQEFSAKVPVHDEQEFQVLRNSMQRKQDRIFRDRIDDAMQRYYAYKAGLEAGGLGAFGETNFEDAEAGIVHLPSLPDNEYGITFKKTGEFGVYSFHVPDSGKISYSYCRSDLMFKERRYLM